MAKTTAIFVPSLWHIEIANVLGIASRKGRLSDFDLLLALSMLESLEIHTDAPLPPTGIAALLPLMRTHSLTAYDAAYLELAKRLDLPLATLDNDLAAASKKVGIPLVCQTS